jgi:hypothetical protein
VVEVSCHTQFLPFTGQNRLKTWELVFALLQLEPVGLRSQDSSSLKRGLDVCNIVDVILVSRTEHLSFYMAGCHQITS